MPAFTPHCPRCGSADLKQVARNDRYPLEGRRLDTPPIATTYAYQCKCGVAFTFEVQHGQPLKSQQTRIREEAKISGYQIDGDTTSPTPS